MKWIISSEITNLNWSHGIAGTRCTNTLLEAWMRFEIKRKFTFRHEIVNLRLTHNYFQQGSWRAKICYGCLLVFCSLLFCFALFFFWKLSKGTLPSTRYSLNLITVKRLGRLWYFSESKQNSVDLYFSAKIFLYFKI